MALIIGVLTRGFSGLTATGTVTIFTILATTALAGWVGIPFSTSTSATPIIVQAFAVANCIHVLITVQERIGAGRPGRRAAANSIGGAISFVLSVTLMPAMLAIAPMKRPLPQRALGGLRPLRNSP